MHRPAGPVQPVVAREHPPLHLPEPGPRLDTEVGHEQVPGGAVEVQRVGPPVTPVQRGHEDRHEVFPGRVPGGQRHQFGDRPRVLPQRELRLGPQFHGDQAQLLDRAVQPVPQLVVRRVGEQRPAPEGEPSVERAHPLGGIGGSPGRPDQVGELVDVDPVPVLLDHVALAPGADPHPVRVERAPQPPDVRLHRAPGRGRRPAVPEQVDEAVGRHHPAHVEQQHPEQATLLAPAADLDRPAVVAGLERPEQAELHTEQDDPARAGGCRPAVIAW